MAQISILNEERIMERTSYVRFAYESENDGSPSWVTSKKLTLSKIQAVKGSLRLKERLVSGRQVKIHLQLFLRTLGRKPTSSKCHCMQTF